MRSRSTSRRGDAVVTLDNVGERPLWFVVGEADAEAAPSDPGVGHLLQPGQRETVRLGADTCPIWAWAPFPTAVGVSAPLAE